MSIDATLFIRLYPRAWRQRYEDEMRALLVDTVATPRVVLDLIVGALREWIRVVTVDPGPAESSAREGWRNIRRSWFATLAMAGLSWSLAQAMLRAGIDPEAGFGYLMVPAVVVTLTGLRGAGRRTRFQFPGPNDTASSSAEVSNPGIGRRQFWIRIVVFGVGLTAWWMVRSTSHHSDGPLPQLEPFLWWFLLYQQMSGLRQSTRTFLARARAVNLLEAARRRALLPPSPWT